MIGQRDGKIQVNPAKLSLHQFQQPIQQKGIIIEVGIEMRFAILIGCKEAIVFP